MIVLIYSLSELIRSNSQLRKRPGQRISDDADGIGQKISQKISHKISNEIWSICLNPIQMTDSCHKAHQN
jgi:hypothetical protein